jgi:hypothetical protein
MNTKQVLYAQHCTMHILSTDASVYCIYLTVVLFMCSKDVRLPVQLQRAMAAEAEATREARAKVLALFS